MFYSLSWNLFKTGLVLPRGGGGGSRNNNFDGVWRKGGLSGVGKNLQIWKTERFVFVCVCERERESEREILRQLECCQYYVVVVDDVVELSCVVLSNSYVRLVQVNAPYSLS